MAIKSELGEPEALNLTPLIDVVFNVLIFFLLGSTLLHESDERELQLNLPTVEHAAPLTPAPDEITVNVFADGRIAIGEEVLTGDALAQRLQAAVRNYPDQVVAVRGDADVRYEEVARVIATCKHAGVVHLDVLAMLEEP